MYLHSLTVDLVVFYSLQISHCVYLSLFTFNIKLLVTLYFWSCWRPSFLNFSTVTINLVIQADILNTFCNSYLSSKKSNKYFRLTEVARMFSIILASFSYCLGSLKISWSGHLLFSAIHERPFQQMSEILLNRLPLLPMSAGFCLVGT